jgi:hypothetical protein
LPYEALYVIGDRDPFYSEKVLEFLKARGKKNQFMVIPGANHELEIEDDFEASVFAQQQILDAIVEFQKRPKPEFVKGLAEKAKPAKAKAAPVVEEFDEDDDDDDGEYDPNDPDYED